MTTTRGSLRRQVVGGVGRLVDLGVQSTDTSQERAAKTALTLAALLMGSFAGVWTLAYFLLGLTAAWVITLVYQVSLLLALGHFALTKRFADIGFDPTPILSDEASAIMRKTGEEWAPVIKRLNIRLD